ncbi:MAG: hypothetical protein ABI679_04690 [Gemmatimonadota bacterium]
MDLYTFSLMLGGAGLAAMAFNSLGHHAGSASGHAGHGHATGHTDHGPAGSSHGHSSEDHGNHTTGSAHHATHSASRAALALLSPRILFSILLGLGLTGSIARSLLGGIPLLAVALGGGIVFERLVISPLWNFLLRFASRPALTLESCVTDDATAVTTFDKRGQGLVAIEVDGQVVQVLGTLQSSDREAGLRVRAGDRVRIEDVDPQRNRCTVSVP